MLPLRLLLTLPLLAPLLVGQNVGIGTAVPYASALLELNASDKGLLLPRVNLVSSTDNATVPTPEHSLLVYNTGSGGLSPRGYYYNDGTPASPNWKKLLNTGDAWLITGNTGTNPTTHFIGTIDNKDLVIRTNNQKRMTIFGDGRVQINTWWLMPANTNTLFDVALRKQSYPVNIHKVVEARALINPPFQSLYGNTTVGVIGNLCDTQLDETLLKMGSYGKAGIVGTASGASGGSRAYGVIGYAANTQTAATGGKTGEICGGSFFGVAWNGHEPYPPFGGDVFIGVRAEANTSAAANTHGATLYGVHSIAVGKAVDGDVTYAGFFEASGGVQNYAVYADRGNSYFAEPVGIATLPTTYALTLPNNSTNLGQAIAFGWNTYSDERIKSNIQELNYGLHTLMQLKPLKYFQHSTAFEEGRMVSQAEGAYTIGFLAQELYQIIPEAVRKPQDEASELWAVDYTKLIPVLVKAVQEQQKLIEELQKENQELRELIKQSKK